MVSNQIIIKKTKKLMLFVLIILFILAAYSSFFEHKNDAKKIIFFILWCLCVSVAGFREAGCDKDSLAYLAVFNNNYTDIIVEKSFHIISSFVKLCFVMSATIIKIELIANIA